MNKRTPFLQEIVEDMIENNSTDQQIEDVVKTYNEQQDAANVEESDVEVNEFGIPVAGTDPVDVFLGDDAVVDDTAPDMTDWRQSKIDWYNSSIARGWIFDPVTGAFYFTQEEYDRALARRAEQEALLASYEPTALKSNYPSLFVNDDFFGDPNSFKPTGQTGDEEWLVKELRHKLEALGVVVKEYEQGKWGEKAGDWVTIESENSGQILIDLMPAIFKKGEGDKNKARVDQINWVIADALKTKLLEDDQFDLDYYLHGVKRAGVFHGRVGEDLVHQYAGFNSLVKMRNNLISDSLEIYLDSEKGTELKLTLVDDINASANNLFLEIVQEYINKNEAANSEGMMNDFMTRMEDIIEWTFNNDPEYKKLIYNISLASTGYFDDVLERARVNDNISLEVGAWATRPGFFNKLAFGLVKGFGFKLPNEFKTAGFAHQQQALADIEKINSMPLIDRGMGNGRKMNWDNWSALVRSMSKFTWANFDKYTPGLGGNKSYGITDQLSYLNKTKYNASTNPRDLSKFVVTNEHIDWLKKEDFVLMHTATFVENGFNTTLGMFENPDGLIEIIPINGRNLNDAGKHIKIKKGSSYQNEVYDPLKYDGFVHPSAYYSTESNRDGQGVSEYFLKHVIARYQGEQFERIKEIIKDKNVIESITYTDSEMFQDGDFNITSENWAEAIGDGVFRAAMSIFTIGFGSVLTEGANAYQAGLFDIARNRISGFDKMGAEDQARALLTILDTEQDKLYDQAAVVGVTNGVLETVGNLFMIGKIGPAIGKNAGDYLRMWYYSNVKQAIKQTARAGISITAASVVEALTEVTQELVTNFAMPGDGSDYNELVINSWDPYVNAATTAFMASTGLVGGGKTMQSFGNSLVEQYQTIRNPEGIIALNKKHKEQLNKDLKDGKITDKEFEEAMGYLSSADRIFTKFQKTWRDPAAVKLLFESEMRVQKEIKEKIKLEKERDEILENAKKLNPGLKKDELLEMTDVAETLADLQFINDKIKREKQEQLKLAYLENYEDQVRRDARKINRKYGANWDAMVYWDNDHAWMWLQNEFGITENYNNKNLTKEQNENIRNLYKNFFKTQKANAFILTKEQLEAIYPGYIKNGGKGIALFSDQNIKKNINAGDITSTNVIAHEFEHILFNEKFKGPEGDVQINNFREELKTSLEQSKNPAVQQVFEWINKKMKETYKFKEKDIGSRVYNEEFLIAFGDYCKALEIYGKMKDGSSFGPEFMAEMTKLGESFWKHIHDSKGKNSWTAANIFKFLSTFKGVNVEEKDVVAVLDENGDQKMDITYQLTDDYSMIGEASNLSYPDRATMTTEAKNRDRLRVNQELAAKIIEAEDHPNPLVRKGALKHRQQLIFNNWAALQTVIKRHYDFNNELHSDVSFDQFRGLVLEEFIKATNSQYDPRKNDSFYNYFFAPQKDKNDNIIGPSIADRRIPAIWEKLATEIFERIEPDPGPGPVMDQLTVKADEEINLQQQYEDSQQRSALRESMQDIFNFKVGDKNYNDFLGLVKEKYMGVDFNDLTDQQLRDLGKDLWRNFRDMAQEGGKFFKKGQFTPLYISFVEGSAKTLFQQMSVKDLVKFLGDDKDLFLDVKTERADTKTSEELKGRDQPKNKYAGNQIRGKKELTPELEQIFIDLLLNKGQFEGRVKRYDALIESTLKNYASVLFNDASMQTITSDSFKEESGISDSQVSQVAGMLNKGLDVKFQLAGTETIIELENLDLKYFDKDGGFNGLLYQTDMLAYLDDVRGWALTNNLEEDYDVIMGYITKYGNDNGFDQGSIELMQSFFDKGFVMDADGSNFQSNISNNNNIDDADKTERKPIRYNTEGKNAMFANAEIMTKIFGKEFMETVGYEFLGFKNSSRTLQMGKEGGEFTDRFNNLIANIPKSELTPELEQALKDYRAMNLGNGSAQNFTNKTTGKDKNLFGRLKAILEDATLTREDKLQKINESGLAAEIEAANSANIIIFEHIVTKFAEQAIAGNIDRKAMLEMFKMSSGTVFGFRSFSQLIGFQVLNGEQTVNKGEHVASMSDINSKIVDLIYRYKKNKNIDFKGELRGILSEFGQVLGNKEHFDLLDEYKRTNTTNTYRLNLFDQPGYTNAKGEDLKTIQANVILKQEQIKNESKAKRKGQVLEDIRYSLAEGFTDQGATISDFDETLIFGTNYIYATKDGKKIRIKSDEFHERVDGLTEEGYEFDFSDFTNVRGDKKAPYFNRLKQQIEQHGVDNVYILTARQPESAIAIQMWLKENGIDLPIENIIGLGVTGPDGKTKTVTAQDKADWIEENLIFNGFNDIEFADDGKKNVEAVQALLDDYREIINRKSKSILIDEKYDPNIDDAKETDIKYQLADLDWTVKDVEGNVDLKSTMDVIIEQDTEIKAYKTYSEAEGKIRGGGVKSLWDLVLPSSTYDLELFTYKMLAKGELGEQQQQFFEQKLFAPFNKANIALSNEKQRLTNEVNDIIKELGKEKHRNLRNLVEGTNFSFEQAVRVYLWSKNNIEIPGLTAETQQALINAVLADPDVQSFADKLGVLTRSKDGYVKPTEYWLVEGISSDLESLTMGVSRASYLAEWKQNVDQIFSPEVKNKLREAYGNDYVDNLENMLYRMEFGRKKTQPGRIETAWSNWVNNSVGAIMFLNMRSASLQLVSAFNYIGFGDNNIINAGKAVANLPQFIKDFSFIFNSDYLKQRRGGETRGVNEAELAKAVKGAKNPVKAMLAYLLKIGFAPTRIADSFAISSGGAAFYRNKIIAYEKQGMSTKDAQNKAFNDFVELTEKNQQSYRPDLVSEQQASNLGRLVQAFANTPQQYFRIMNKAMQDLAAGRGDAKSQIAKIAYYGAVQSSIFVALQQSLLSKFGEEEEEWDEAKKRAYNGMIDNFLTGMGFSGQILRTAKNSYMEWKEQKAKGYNADHAYTILQFANLSPTIGSKLRKLYSAIKGEQINEEIIDKMGWNIHNPGFNAMAQLISATTNIPVDRAIQKVQNILIASKSDTEVIDKVQLLLGWNPWDLNMDKVDVIQEAKEQVEIDKDIEKQKKKEEKLNENQNIIDKEVEKEKEENKDVNQCGATKKDGTGRCSEPVDKPGQKCQYHASEEEKAKMVKCGFIKKNKKQCGNYAVTGTEKGGKPRCNVEQHQVGYESK